MTINQIAEIAHEANRVYCQTMGDTSQTVWEYALKTQKDSVINGVKFHLANPNSKPEDSHNNWLKHKKEEGWKYGPVKDPSKKEHPCFKPYSELPVEQQIKDHLFSAICKTLFPFLSAP